jgi:hypothetical protein
MKNMGVPKDNTRTGDMLGSVKIPLFVRDGFDKKSL